MFGFSFAIYTLIRQAFFGSLWCYRGPSWCNCMNTSPRCISCSNSKADLQIHSGARQWQKCRRGSFWRSLRSSRRSGRSWRWHWCVSVPSIAISHRQHAAPWSVKPGKKPNPNAADPVDGQACVWHVWCATTTSLVVQPMTPRYARRHSWSWWRPNDEWWCWMHWSDCVVLRLVTAVARTRNNTVWSLSLSEKLAAW